MNIKIRLIIMNFLQFAVWGAYLTSMGTYLTKNWSGKPYRNILCHAGYRFAVHAGHTGYYC